jgi:hypothetical protein
MEGAERWERSSGPIRRDAAGGNPGSDPLPMEVKPTLLPLLEMGPGTFFHCPISRNWSHAAHLPNDPTSFISRL